MDIVWYSLFSFVQNIKSGQTAHLGIFSSTILRLLWEPVATAVLPAPLTPWAPHVMRVGQDKAGPLTHT